MIYNTIHHETVRNFDLVRCDLQIIKYYFLYLDRLLTHFPENIAQ